MFIKYDINATYCVNEAWVPNENKKELKLVLTFIKNCNLQLHQTGLLFFACDMNTKYTLLSVHFMICNYIILIWWLTPTKHYSHFYLYYPANSGSFIFFYLSYFSIHFLPPHQLYLSIYDHKSQSKLQRVYIIGK